MARTVSVRLAMDVADYKHGATAATQDTKSLVDQLHDAARASDKTAMAMARTGAEAENAKRGVKNLAGGFDSLDRQLHQTDAALKMVDVQIGKTRREIELLALQAAATGDVDVFKSLRAKRGELGMQSAVRKELTATKGELETQLEKFGRFFAKTGQDAGIQFANQAGTGMLGALKVLPPEIQAVLIGAVTVAAAAAAPALGAMVGGAVLAGIGTAGVGAGLALAISDPRVKSAGADLGATLMADLRLAGASFVPATLKSIEVIRASFRSLMPSLKAIFGQLSGELTRLAGGIGGFGGSMMPGLREAIAASLPILRLLERELPYLGAAFSDMFHSIASGGRGAGEGFQVLMDFVENAVRNVGMIIGFLERRFANFVSIAAATGHGLEDAFGWVPLLGGRIKAVTGYYDHLGHSLGAVSGMTGDAAAGFGNVDDSAAEAAAKVQELKDAFDKLFGIQMTIDRATDKYRKSIDDLTVALKEGARSLDSNTDIGRKHRDGVLNEVQAIKDLRDANIANHMTMADADRVYDQQLVQLERTAEKLGYNTSQVRALVDAYRKIPGRVAVAIMMNTDPAYRALNGLQAKINSLKNQHIYVEGSVRWTSSGDFKVPGGTQVKNERGGIYEHAASGLLREAAMYSPQGPARYAFAEPVTGGEAFIPKHGDMARSRDIWGYVGQNWLGMQPAPRYVAAGRGGGGQPVVNVSVNVQGGDGRALEQELLRTLRYTVRTEGGGSVQDTFGSISEAAMFGQYRGRMG